MRLKLIEDFAMNCKAVQSRLSAYLDRELTGTELLELRDHLRNCDECRAEETELRQLKNLLGSLSVAEPSADLADRLCARVLTSAPVAEPRINLRRSIITFSAVAACSMMATLFIIERPQAPTAKARKIENARFDVLQDQAYDIGYDATSGSPVSTVSNYVGR
jgi:predicted anti-sigma-YlaC factor YlaD